VTETRSPIRIVLDTNVLLRALINRASRSRDVTYDTDLLSLPTSRREAGKRFRQRLRGVSVERPEELIRQHPELLAPP
jgi:predicted nucleic acid-binding protein